MCFLPGLLWFWRLRREFNQVQHQFGLLTLNVIEQPGLIAPN